MAYNYNTIQTFVQRRCLPKLHDNIFLSNNYFLRRLKERYKTYNERRIEVALEYAKLTNIDFLSRGETINLAPEETHTKAYFDPKMYAGSLTILKEDELENMSDRSIARLLEAKTTNLMRSIEESIATHIWTRGETALPDSNGWNTVDYLVSAQSAVDVGDLLSSGSVPTWWRSKVLTQSDFPGAGALTNEADLIDKNSNVYVKRLLQRVLAKARYQTGSKPTDIMVPQYIWDLIENTLEEAKRTSKLTERIGAMGFTALDFRGTAIVADDFMVAAQSGDNDGYMCAFNLDHMYMFLNSAAAFTIGPFIQPANQLARSALVIAYGNIAISNRRTQVKLTGLRSPQDYCT